MLHEFISTHRQELIERARAKVAQRAAPRPTSEELSNGVPLFLTQVTGILKQELARSAADGPEMGLSATQHGKDLLQQGFSIAQVVYDYGDICQAVTELALELRVPIAIDEFHTLNRCLDNAIASAVTEYSRQRGVDASGEEVRRQGFFAHELRNYLNSAMLAFQAVRSGRVGVTGSTGMIIERSLRGIRDVIERSLSEVRLASAVHYPERLRLMPFIEEVEIDASMVAISRDCRFSVERGDSVDDSTLVHVDRHLFASAISNLMQNAFKFTRPSGQVWLRTRCTVDRVTIEVEDECGGLPPGASETIFRVFDQHGTDRSGLGLGLSISRQAIEGDGGTLSVRDIPGKGCVFTVDMPRAVADFVEA